MSTPNTGLILHLNFAQITDGKLADASGNDHDGTPQGHPLLVPDDAFGSCLNLDGTDDYVSLPDLAADYSNGLTVEAWVFYSSFRPWSRVIDMGNGPAADNFLLCNSGAAGSLGFYIYRGGAAKWVEAAGALRANEWMHVAAVVDAAGNATLYVNAQPVASGPSQLPQKVARGNNYIGRSNWPADPYLHGKIASARVYNRALSPAEVRQDMLDDQTAGASFRASYPLTFRLFDREDNQQVVYITDLPEGREMGFEVSNTSRKAITLPAPDAPQVSAQNHHFELRLRAGTLSAGALTRLALADPGWAMLKPPPDQPAQNGGVVSLYFLSATERTLNPSDKITLTLSGVAADPGAGARGTRAELRFKGLHYPGDATPLDGTRIQHLNVVNHRGQKTVPLHVGFLDSNTVLNDGTSQNQLRLRITNVSKTALALTPAPGGAASKFVITFDTRGDTETGKDWALGTASQVNSIRVTAPGWTPLKPEAKTPEWILTTAKTSLAPGEVIELTLAGIKTSLPSGMTNVYIRYENIPGHWDGQFVSAIEKAPILYRGDRVGIGTSDPQAKLQVRGGDLRLDAGREILFEDNGQIRSADNNHRILFRRGENKLELREFGSIIFSPGASAGNETAKVVMLDNGNVGIGRTEPGKTLTVKGGLRVDNEVSVGGSGAFEVDAPGVVGGRFKVGSNGRVGIGTTKPLSGLSISNVKNQADSPNQEIGQLTFVGFDRNVASASILAQSPSWDDQSHLIFKTSSSGTGAQERVRITSGGNVGIGTTEPGKTLTVKGGLRVDNEVSVGGSGAFEVDAPGVVGGRFKVGSNGRVGIGTSDPSVPLDVRGFANVNMQKGFWFAFKNEQRNSNNTYDNSVSIKAQWGVLSEQAFYITSDSRVKKDLKGSEPAADLDILGRLRVTDFKYVDTATRGDRYKKGFIAQQVEEVFPQAVSKQTGVVPDLYRQAPHADGWVGLATDLKQGERVRLISERGEGVYEVLEAAPDKFRTDFKPEGDKVFVFGREVQDFRILDHDAIAVLNVSATQQLKKEKDEEVKALRAENAELRAALDGLAQRLQLLESRQEAAPGVAGAWNGSHGNGRR